MIVHRGFRFKLAPTAEQESLFRQFAGACRFVYNLALEQRSKYRDTYAYAGIPLTFVQQSKELTALRAEVDWLADAPATCEEQALRDLDKAFVNFFTGRGGHPTPRRKGMHDTFRFKGMQVAVRPLNAKWASVRLPKIGWVKFRLTRHISGEIRTATISGGVGGWHIAFACKLDIPDAVHLGPSVGIDRGIATSLMLSTGEAFAIPKSLAEIDRRHRAAQRVLARRKKGSSSRRKAKARCAVLAARRARIRKDWHHRISSSIASRFGTVVLEDLRIVDMTASAKGSLESPGRNVRQKAGLNRSILNQGWGNFGSLLDYKLEEQGGTLVLVNPAYTSQTCSECGTVDKGSRKSQAVFHCLHCGFRAHADHNAAINILRRNTASMGVEEGHWLSVETLTRSSRRAAENQPALVG